MSTEKRQNNNDLTTGDRLYDSGVRTDGTPSAGEPRADEGQEKPIERNYSTYAAEAAAQTVDPAPPDTDP